MFNKKLRMNKKAVSPIIATLLLVAIAVSAAVVTYTWTMSMVTNQATQAQTQIKIDVVKFINATDIEVNVRNTGTMPATLQKAYTMSGTAVSVTATDVDGTVIEPNTVETISITFPASTFETTNSYQIRIITTTGYVVEGVYYAPANFPT